MVKKTAAAKPADNTPPVLSEVQKLYDFMKKNSLETIEYQEDGTHVRLVRQRAPHVPVPVAATAGQAVSSGGPAAAPAPAQSYGDAIKSPLMGIFYRAPSPSSPPFVREGAAVKAGQVVCLIEAMKVFNEVKAEVDCVVTKVLVENGKPVKPGQELLAIEKR